jgi:hypothetical protein
MPTATAIPPGIQFARARDEEVSREFRKMRIEVVIEKIRAAHAAHSATAGGRPLPVTRRAV